MNDGTFGIAFPPVPKEPWVTPSFDEDSVVVTASDEDVMSGGDHPVGVNDMAARGGRAQAIRLITCGWHQFGADTRGAAPVNKHQEQVERSSNKYRQYKPLRPFLCFLSQCEADQFHTPHDALRDERGAEHHRQVVFPPACRWL